MAKKVIQVPFDEALLDELNQISKKQKRTRAELIRQACNDYLKKREEEELDRIYRHGYERIPESTELAEAQVSILSKILPKETW